MIEHVVVGWHIKVKPNKARESLQQGEKREKKSRAPLIKNIAEWKKDQFLTNAVDPTENIRKEEEKKIKNRTYRRHDWQREYNWQRWQRESG